MGLQPVAAMGICQTSDCTCECPEDTHAHDEACNCECERCVEWLEEETPEEVKAVTPAVKKRRPSTDPAEALVKLIGKPTIKGIAGARWERVSDPNMLTIPRSAMVAGQFNETQVKPIYLARLLDYRHGIMNGQAAGCIGGIQICAAGNEVIFSDREFQVLTDKTAGRLKWKDRPQSAAGWKRLNKCAVVVGVERLGRLVRTSAGETKQHLPSKKAQPLWAARVFYKGSVLVGKAGPGIGGGRAALVAVRTGRGNDYSGEERLFHDFEVLVDCKLDKAASEADGKSTSWFGNSGKKKKGESEEEESDESGDEGAYGIDLSDTFR